MSPGRRTAGRLLGVGALALAMGSVVGVAGSVAPAGAAGSSQVLKLAMADSATSPTYKFAEQFATNVSKDTGGQLTVKVYPNNELGAASAEITGVQAGTIAFIATPDLTAVVPDMDVAIMPYLFTSMKQAQKVLNSSAIRSVLWNQVTKYKINVVGTWPIGPVGIFTNAPDADSLAAVKGQKIRTFAPLVMSPLLKAWGLNPTPIASTQVLESLSTGLIDGAFDPPTPITDQGWTVYGKSYIETNAVFNIDPLVMSQKIFSSLSAKDQKVIRQAFAATLPAADREITQLSATAVKTMKAKNIGVYTGTAAFKRAAAKALPAWNKAFGAKLVARVKAVVKKEVGG